MDFIKESDFFEGPSPEGALGEPSSPLSVQYGSGGDGVDVYLVQAEQGRSVHAQVHSDSDAAHFSYWLRGGAVGCVDGRSFNLSAGQVAVACAPGRDFEMSLSSDVVNIEIVVRPDRLIALAGDCAIVDEVGRGQCLRERVASAQGRSVAERLACMIRGGQRTGLMLQAVALEGLAWQIDAPESSQCCQSLSRREREALEAARTRLLSNLANVPTIAELAREVGINTLKLKRGFRAQFGTSVYGLYQQTRMQHARKLLDDCTVTETALAVGYSNISHFSTAFRKQFGVLPSEFRRRIN